MSYQKPSPSPVISRQNSHGNYSSLPDMPLVNSKEQTMLWQQSLYMGDSGIHSGASTHASSSLCGKEDHIDNNSVTSHWHQSGCVQGSHANFTSLPGMPLANPKEQTLLWEQNSYMGDSGIHSVTSTHAAPSLCGEETHLNSKTVDSQWLQPGLGQGFTEEQMDGCHDNYSSSQDMPLVSTNEQSSMWQQDSGIHSEMSTRATQSVHQLEDHLDCNNSVIPHWQQYGFKQGSNGGQMDEISQHLNQARSERACATMLPENLEKGMDNTGMQFNPAHPTAIQHQFEPSHMLEHSIMNLINYQNDANLIKLLNWKDQAVVKDTVAAIHQLLKNEASLYAVINSPHILATLVRIMSSSNDLNTIESACGVFHKLSLHKDGLLAIYKSSGIPVLVKLLSLEVERVLNYVITTLHNLLLDQEGSIIAVCSAGGLQKMIKLLHHHNAQFLSIVADCLRILAYGNRQIKLIMLESGCSAELVRIMMSYTYDKLLCRTSSLLRSLLKSLSICSVKKLEIIDAGGIQALAKHLGHDKQQLVLNCLWSLRFLSDAATKQDNVDELLRSLVQLLKSDNTEVVMHAAYILCNMTCNERNKVTVCRVGGIDALIHAIIQAGDAEKITEPAVCALRHITVNHPDEKLAQNTVRLQNGLPVLVKLLYPPSRWPLIKAMLGLIRNLALCTANHAPLRELAVIPRLIQLLSKAYWNNQKQQFIMGSNDSQTECMDGVRMEEIIERTLEILKNLTLEADCRTVIRGLGVKPLLIQLLNNGIKNIQRVAADVLHNLGADSGDSKMIEDGDVVFLGKCSGPSNVPLAHSKEQALLQQQNLCTADSRIHSRSTTQTLPSVCRNEDDLNSVPLSFDWEPEFKEIFSQEQVNAARAQFLLSKNKSQDCKQRLSAEPTNSSSRDYADRWRECIGTDVNKQDQAFHGQIYQGNQGPPIVHNTTTRHHSYALKGFDLQIPVDSLHGHDFAKQGSRDDYENLATNMDFDGLPEINFETLDSILPPSPEDADATQMFDWCSADQYSSMLLPSPQKIDATQMRTWHSTNHQDPMMPHSLQDVNAAQIAAWYSG